MEPACVDSRMLSALKCWACGGDHEALSCFGREMQRSCANCGSQQHVAYTCPERGMSTALQLFMQAGGDLDRARLPGQGRSRARSLPSSSRQQVRPRARSMGRRRY